MNKQQIILISIIGLAFIGIWWLAYNDMGTVDPVSNPETQEIVSEEQASEEAETVSSVTPAPAPQQTGGMENVEVVTPSKPAPETGDTQKEAVPERETPEEIESGSYVDKVFAGDNSKRCTWKDRDTGLEGMALIKDGKVLVESERNDGDDMRMTLYTSAATYVWIEDADEGTVIPNDLNSDDEVVSYQTRPEIAEYIETNEWVECNEQALSDSHFELPRGVAFSEPATF